MEPPVGALGVSSGAWESCHLGRRREGTGASADPSLLAGRGPAGDTSTGMCPSRYQYHSLATIVGAEWECVRQATILGILVCVFTVCRPRTGTGEEKGSPIRRRVFAVPYACRCRTVDRPVPGVVRCRLAPASGRRLLVGPRVKHVLSGTKLEKNYGS